MYMHMDSQTAHKFARKFYCHLYHSVCEIKYLTWTSWFIAFRLDDLCRAMWKI